MCNRGVAGAKVNGARANERAVSRIVPLFHYADQTAPAGQLRNLRKRNLPQLFARCDRAVRYA